MNADLRVVTGLPYGAAAFEAAILPWRSISRFAEQVEHILLIEFHAGLVEGIDAQHIGRDAARQLEEEEQLAERIGADAVGLQHTVSAGPRSGMPCLRLKDCHGRNAASQ